MPYFFANAKSRSSCAGTPITAAVAVAHQHVVADPDRDGPAGERVRDGQAGEAAHLVLRREFGLGGAALLAFLDEGGEGGVALGGVGGQRMLGATAQKVTPLMVSARVVKTYSGRPGSACRRRRGCRA